MKVKNIILNKRITFIQNQNQNLTLIQRLKIQASFSFLFYICTLLNKLLDSFSFSHFHNRINTYTGYSSVMIFWYFSAQKFVLTTSIKSLTLAFIYFSSSAGMLLNFMFNAFLILFHILLYFANTLSFSIIKDKFFPPFLKNFMYPLIWGKIIHNGLMTLSSLQPIKYLKPLLLCSNLSDINIGFKFTEFKAIDCLEALNFFY